MANRQNFFASFRSRTNNPYTIIISTGGSSNARIDYCAKSPVTVDEDANEDMLNNTVRKKTGYVNVIENSYGDLNDIYPTTAKEVIVNIPSVFWGYVQPQSFGNKWEEGPRTIKLPIQSILSTFSNTPGPISDVKMKYTIKEMLSGIVNMAGLLYVVFPKGEEIIGSTFNGVIHSFISSLVVCPFRQDCDYQYTEYTLFDPLSCLQIIEAICKRWGMICHEGFVNGYRSLIFAKPDYDGDYQLWSASQLETPSSTANSIDTTGDTVRVFADVFTVCSDSNNEMFISPYSKITYHQEGNELGTVPFTPQISKYNSVIVYKGSWAHALLAAVGGWLVSDTLSSTTLNNSTCLCGIYDTTQDQAEEYIRSEGIGWSSQNHEMFRVRIYANPSIYKVAGKVMAYLSSTTSYTTDPNFTKFGLGVCYGGYWWDMSEDEEGWQLNPQQKIKPMSPDASGIFWTLDMDNPSEVTDADYYEIVFFSDPANDAYRYAKAFGKISLERPTSQQTTKYTKYEVSPDIVKIGTYGSMEDAEVSQLFSQNRNTNYLTQQGGSLQNKDYMLHSVRRREITVLRNGNFDYTYYLCQWDFGDNLTWRLIAAKENVEEESMTLYFHGSEYF